MKGEGLGSRWSREGGREWVKEGEVVGKEGVVSKMEEMVGKI